MGHKPNRRGRAARTKKMLAANEASKKKRGESSPSEVGGSGDDFAARMHRKADEARVRLDAERKQASEKASAEWVAREVANTIGLCRADVEAAAAAGKFEHSQTWVFGNHDKASVHDAVLRILKGLSGLGLKVEVCGSEANDYLAFTCRW